MPRYAFAFLALSVAVGLVAPGLAVEASQETPVAAPVAQAIPPLDLAFDAVLKMPLRPHIKTRSRLQADLVQAALDVGRVADATAWATQIENWRQGLALAHIAVHHAQGRDEEAAHKAIERAEAFERTITSEDAQGWRRDRVRVRIAEAYALLGDARKAAQIQATATPAESGRLAAMAVRTVGDADIEKQIATLKTIAKTGDLEQVRFALMAMAEFYGRALAKPSAEDASMTPDAVEQHIKSAWTELPIEPRIDIVERLIQFDVDAGPRGKARASAHAKEVAGLVMDHNWNREQAIGLRARVAGLYHSLGDDEAASKVANDALTLYETSREGIVSIYRGEALRPLAEAFLALGDEGTATSLYERALEEALENPNSRPRVTDLTMTAISVATAPDYTPPRSLVVALSRASQAIGDPW